MVCSDLEMLVVWGEEFTTEGTEGEGVLSGGVSNFFFGLPKGMQEPGTGSE